MYPPAQTVTAPTPITPAPQPAPSTPTAGSGGGAPAGGGGSPAGQPPHQVATTSLAERLNAAAAALDSTANTHPAADPVAAAQAAAAPVQPQVATAAPDPGQSSQPYSQPGQPPVPGAAQPQPAAAPAAEAPEVAQMRAQLAANAAEVARMRQEAQALQQYAAYGYQMVQAQRAGQPAAAAPPAPAAAAPAPASVTGVPEFDQNLLAFIGQDAEGNPTLKPGAPPDLLQRYDQYRRANEQFFRNFARDPMAVLGPALDKRIEERATALAESRVKQASAQQHLENYVAANQHIFFVTDPQTRQPAVDGFGRRVLSDVGNLFVQTAGRLEQAGVRDPLVNQQMTEQLVLGQLALRKLQSGQAMTAAQQQQAVQQVQQAQAVAAQAAPAQPQPAAYTQPAPQPQATQPYHPQPAAVHGYGVPQPTYPNVPLAAAAQQVRDSFVAQHQAAGQQYPGGPATPQSLTPAPVHHLPSAGGQPMSLSDRLRRSAASVGIDMSQV